MANYHKRNSIRAVQWDPEDSQSFEDIKKLIAENPGIGWKADNIVRNDASDNIIIRSFGMIVLRIKPYEYLVEGKKDSLFIVPAETFELMYKSDEGTVWNLGFVRQGVCGTFCGISGSDQAISGCVQR